MKELFKAINEAWYEQYGTVNADIKEFCFDNGFCSWEDIIDDEGGDGKESPWSIVKGDFDGYVEKRFLPYHVSKEEAEEIAGETWIEPTYSAYDCTGRPFTVSMDFYDVPGGTWIYHCVGFDV